MEELDYCMVSMNGTVSRSNDFVTILSKENGDASIYYNTDALTLGMALKIFAKEFIRCLNECSEEERNDVTQILGEAFVCDSGELANVEVEDA